MVVGVVPYYRLLVINTFFICLKVKESNKEYEMLYIALEGYECSGKSTLVKKLFEHYGEDDRVVFVREPGTTKVAEQLRTIMLANDGDVSGLVEFLLLTTARVDLLDKVVNKALEDNKIVITDRSVFSGLLLRYLRGGIDIGLMDRVSNELLTNVPNKVFSLEVDKEVIAERLANRHDNNSYDTLSYYDGFVELQKEFVEAKLRDNKLRTRILDGSIKETHSELLARVDSYLKIPNNTKEETEVNFKNIVEMIDCYRDR